AIHRRRFPSTNAERRQRFGIRPLANSKPHLLCMIGSRIRFRVLCFLDLQWYMS
ncbi:unnamed protein product, partial [Musa hybrid cultivar]